MKLELNRSTLLSLAMLSLCLVASILSPAKAYTIVYTPATSGPRTIDWTYDGTCPATPAIPPAAPRPSFMSEQMRATRILDRLLPTVTINYKGLDGTGFIWNDNKNTVSCHDQTWFADGSGTLHKLPAPNAGAFSDHHVIGLSRYFDMAFNTTYIGTAPGIYESALHEWLHIVALDHSPADRWSAVYAYPFCWAAPTQCNPHHAGWTEYPSNDDIVGMSTYYQHAADCTPYYYNGLLYLPYVPTTSAGVPVPTAATPGVWAVLKNQGGGNFAVLDTGAAHTYKYDCAMRNYNNGIITATGYDEASGQLVGFTMRNNDPTGVNKTSWSISVP